MEQAGKACLVKGLVRDQERTSVFRHIYLSLSMKGKEKKFHVPALCSVISSLTSGSPNPANSPMGLLLLPLKTFDISSTENTPGFAKRNQVNVFCLVVVVGWVFCLVLGLFCCLFFVWLVGCFFLGGKVFFLDIFVPDNLYFLIALLRPFFKNRPMS